MDFHGWSNVASPNCLSQSDRTKNCIRDQPSRVQLVYNKEAKRKVGTAHGVEQPTGVRPTTTEIKSGAHMQENEILEGVQFGEAENKHRNFIKERN